MLQGKGLNRAEIAARLQVADQPGIINVLKACPEPNRPRAVLTSPEAYALHVPDTWQFDILVIDEASQMPLASATAAIAASKQIVVCGDSQQMPPETKADGSQVTSLLTAAERAGFPVRMLEYHYRSRHPALINVANQLHYDTRLRIVPSLRPETHYGVKFHFVDGRYDPETRKGASQHR
jgi:superfamily I DNA and/or RNA helicase